MRRMVLPTIAALLLFAACRDVTQQTPAQEAEQAAAPEEAAPSAAAAPAADQQSTLCAAYNKQLGQARGALAREPKDATLQENVATFEAVIADACN